MSFVRSELVTISFIMAFLCSNLAFAGGIIDPQLAPNAAVQAFKHKLAYANDAAYVTAKTASYVANGVRIGALGTSDVYFNTTLNAWRYHTGAAWATSAPAPGGALSLDDVYSNGQTITRDAGEFRINDATLAATNTMYLNRTAGAGAVLQIRNAGTGNDITGDLWSIDTAGRFVGTRFDLGDSQSVRFGAAQDITMVWDGTKFVVTPIAANYQWDFGTDGVGMDLLLNSGTAGDYFRFDSSDKMLYGDDVSFKLSDNDKFFIGTKTGVAAVDGDFELYFDGTSLHLLNTTGGDPIVLGAAGAGPDLTIYGQAGASYAKFDYNAAGDQLIMNLYGERFNDSTSLKFGTDEDLLLTFDNATGTLAITGAAGTEKITWGADAAGIKQTFYTNTSGSSIALDGIASDDLVFTNANAFLKDGSAVIYGTGRDITAAYAGGTNILEWKQASAGVGSVTHGEDGEGITEKWFLATASSYIEIDNTNDLLNLNAANQRHSDNAWIGLGDGAGVTAPDIKVALDTTPGVVPGGQTQSLHFTEPTPDNGVAEWGDDGDGFDQVLWGENATEYAWYDAQTASWKMVGGNVSLKDNTSNTSVGKNQILLGNTQDVLIGYSAASGLTIGPTSMLGSPLAMHLGSSGTRAFTVDWSANNNAKVTWKVGAGMDRPYVGHQKADLQLNTDAVFYLGVNTLDSAPTTGSAWSANAGGTEFYHWSPNATSKTIHNWNGSVANDGDECWYGVGGTEQICWDYGDSAWLAKAGASMGVADASQLRVGLQGGNPRYFFDYDGAFGGVGGMDTGGGANVSFQVGSSAADHQITFSFGDPAVKAVEIDGNATMGQQIEYKTIKPVTKVMLPGGSFSSKTTTADENEGTICSAGLDYGQRLDKTTDECTTATWVVPVWADVATAIPMQILWVADDANLAHTWAANIGYKVIVPDTTLTSAASTALDNSPKNLVNANAQCTIHQSPLTGGVQFELPAATVTAGQLVRLEICRDADDSGGGAVDNIDSDVNILGLQLSVTRKYAD